MAQTGFTPISNYYSATTTNVPAAGNLIAGELAINTADGKLFYKDSNGTVQTIATKSTAALPSTTTGSGSIVLATSPTVTTPIIATTLGVGGATPSASGAGITFPATQSASSNANTLDDYEEGTWTPTFAFTGGSTGITYSIQSGYYTKIGNRVSVNCYLQFSNKGSSTGNLRIEGLPFTASASSNSFTPATIWGNNLTGLTAGSWNVYIDPNTTATSDFYRLSTSTQVAVNNTQVTNTTDVMIQATYMAA